MNQLLHIIPIATESSKHIRSQTLELAQKNPALREVLRDADFMVQFAMSIFRGACPTNDSAIRLDWYDDYHDVSKYGSRAFRDDVLNRAVAQLVESVSAHCTSLNKPPESSFVDFTDGDEARLDAQFAALAIVIALDGAIERLLSGHGADSLLWQAQAFRNFHSLRDDLKAGLELEG